MVGDLSAALLGTLLVGVLMLILGGVVKGTLGVGLPLVTVPMLSLLVPAQQAMGLLVLPVLLSNMIQSVQGGRFFYAFRRFWPLILAQLVATLAAVYLSQYLTASGLNLAIAITVFSSVALMVFQPRGEISARHQVWAGPVVGALAGGLGGLSSLTGPMLITYLMTLRLKREEFVGSISIIYFLGAVPMYAAMLWWHRFGWSEVGWSCLAMGPVYLGMALGRRLREHLSEQLFRRLLLSFLVLLAVMLIFK